MNYLKHIMRKILSQRQWQQLAHLKARWRAGVYMRAFARLPMPQAVAAKEGIRLTGKLDYPHAEILMTLDSSIQLGRLHACKKEPETIAWLETYLRPGEVLYDIGANVGAYSFVAYVVTSGDCTIYAFEPSFSTFAALSQNVLLNHCQDKIVPLQLALSDETKLLAFNYSSFTPGSALHRLGEPSGEVRLPFQPEFSQPILTYRLDDLVHQFMLRRPNHIKLDVDGAELGVLCGAEEILAYPGLRSVLVEVDEQRYPSGEIWHCLESKGFRLRSRHPRGQSETLANYIFER
jgi:FkbM family methyltransferase